MALMSPENLIHDISPNAAPSWVCGQIEQVPKLTLIHFAARAWCEVHDVYACAFTPEARLDLQPTSPSLYAKHRAGIWCLSVSFASQRRSYLNASSPQQPICCDAGGHSDRPSHVQKDSRINRCDGLPLSQRWKAAPGGGSEELWSQAALQIVQGGPSCECVGRAF